MIGHPGNVVANDSMPGTGKGEFSECLRHRLRMLEIKMKKLAEGFDRAFPVADNGRIAVQARLQESLQRAVFRDNGWAESREAPRSAPNVFDTLRARDGPCGARI